MARKAPQKTVKRKPSRSARTSLTGDASLDVLPKIREAQGVSGTQVSGGYISSREVSSELRGITRYTTFGDLLANVSIISASVRYILNLVARPSWSFDPANETDEAKRLADLVSTALLTRIKTPFRRVVRRASTYRLYGFGLQEWSMSRAKEGHLAIDDIEPRPQRTIEKWHVDETGTVYAVGQRSVHDGTLKPIPRSKLLYLVDDALDDSPEGLGVLRQVAGAARRLQRYEQLEGWGYETDLKGVPVARVPYSQLAKMVKKGDLTPAERSKIIEPVEGIIKNHIRNPNMGVLLDSITYTSQDQSQTPSATPLFSFDVLKGEVTANAQQAVHTAIERVVWDIARTFSTESLLLGANGRGAFALSKDKTASLLMVIDGMISDIVDQVRSDIVTPMFEWNDWPLDLLPLIKTDASQYRNPEEITGALRDLAMAGSAIQQDDPAVNVVRKSLGLPPQPEIRLSDLVAQGVAEATGGIVGPDGRPIPALAGSPGRPSAPAGGTWADEPSKSKAPDETGQES